MNSRREFINGAGAVALMSAVCPPSFAGSAQRRLRAGIVSDIHVRGPGWTLDPFIAALKWFDAQKVDVVAVAGDLTDFGLVEELRHVGKAWDDVFPGGRAGDGRAVEKVFVTGNHDNHFYNHAHVKKKYPDADERFARSIARDFDAAWRECFHEPFKPFSVKTVKGYRFVAVNYAQKGLAAFIEKNKAEFADLSKPFFYVQHQHLRDTCHGPMAWGRDKGESTRALSAFPNAVAFSGHSHYPLTDERAIWQGSFTSIGTASLKYIAPPEFCDYENGFSPGKDREKEMEGLAWSRSQHLMLMDVFDDRLVIARHALENGEFVSLGADWTIPVPFAEPPPYAFAARSGRIPAPQFAADAKIEIELRDGVNRKKKPRRQVQLRFPEATAAGRVFDYEVKVEPLDPSRKTLTRYVLSPNFHLGKRAYASASCVFGADELPDGCRFTVVPRSSFGRQGNPLASEVWRR